MEPRYIHPYHYLKKDMICIDQTQMKTLTHMSIIKRLNREPQEYHRNIPTYILIFLLDIPTIFLGGSPSTLWPGLCSCYILGGSLLGSHFRPGFRHRPPEAARSRGRCSVLFAKAAIINHVYLYIYIYIVYTYIAHKMPYILHHM